MVELNTAYLGYGLGLRAQHYDDFLKSRPSQVQWLEIISENYMLAHKGYWEMLADLRHDYAFVMHGVSLSIGSTDPINMQYLASLKRLADFLEVAWCSDHLCYTGVRGENTHDLLPIPYTEEALTHLIPRIHYVQEVMGRAFVFENASSYLEFSASNIPEPEFLAELHKATGCGILLDVNNVYVSSFNHGWDAKAYIDAIPAQAVVQYHLAGHTHKGSHIIDTHNAHVIDEVWDLYTYTLRKIGERSIMIEWDADIPPLVTLLEEIVRAKTIAEALLQEAA
jgi:uncharacterized protein